MSEEVGIGAVVFTKDVRRMATFYASVAGLRTVAQEADHARLEVGGAELVLHAIPAPIAASIHIAEPPERREETPIKLSFTVADLAEARRRAAAAGGVLDPPDREWEHREHRICDGHDPEGNVYQLRMPITR